MFFKLLRMTPADMDMVEYWKRNESVLAKLTQKNGASVMYMENEKYPLACLARGYLLSGKLSKLKHEIKNQIFNDSWAKMGNTAEEQIVADIKKAVENIYPHYEVFRYDVLPVEKLSPAVKEIHRAWSKIAPDSKVRDMVTVILQEDDSYRFRFQWIVSFMNPWTMRFRDPVKCFERGLEWLEHGEIIGDMKERVRLFRTIMMIILRDKQNREFLTKLFREVDWSKVKLAPADKYFFRAKYFKVDLDKFDY